MNGRRLIFYFYAMEGLEDNLAYHMHFSCLKKYSHLFESAKFFIAVDDTNNKELISKVAAKIALCGFVENTEFVVVKNDVYREAGIFKTEVVDKLDELTGLTFFAHTKGVTNFLNPEYNKDSILKWIFGCYYLSLEFIDDVHTQLQINQPCYQRFFYGSFLRNIPPEDGGGTKYGAEYEGTFFWINCVSLSNYLKERGISVPNEIGRFYAERFPGDLFSVKERVGSYQYSYLYGPISLYNDCDTVYNTLLSDESDLERLYSEYAKILPCNGD